MMCQLNVEQSFVMHVWRLKWMPFHVAIGFSSRDGGSVQRLNP